MQLSLFSLLAAALPILLVQHATPVIGAALCLPGVDCPNDLSMHSLDPACSSSGDVFTTGSSPTEMGTSSAKAIHTSTSIVLLPSQTPTAVFPTDGTISTNTPSAPSMPAVPGAPGLLGTPSVASIPSLVVSPLLPGGASTPHPVSSATASADPAATTTVTVTGSGPSPTGSCNTGPVQCCNSVESSSSENATKMLGLLGVVLQGTNVPVGLTCTPITAIGASSAGTCNAQTVCCENNNFNGLINIGCTPINIGL